MRAAGYLRVSTEEQKQHGWNLGADRQKIEAMCAERGWQPPVMFDDAALQGDDPERPALLELLSRLDEFDVVIMRAQDRISRDPVIWGTVAAAAQRASVRLETFTGPIDLDTPQGRFVADMMAAVGKLEKGQIGQRVLQSKEARAAAGGHNGGGVRTTFGFLQVDGRGPLLVNRAEAEIVARIFDLADSGVSQRKIAQRLDVEGIRSPLGKRWSQGVVARILKNPIYAGMVRRKVGGRIEKRRSPRTGVEFKKRIGGTWELYEGQHEAIVDRELFDRVNRSLTARHTTKDHAGAGGRPPAGSHLLRRGTLRCGQCGSAMIPVASYNGRPEVYRCIGRRDHGPEHCRQPSIRREAVDEALLRELTSRYIDLEATRDRLAARQRDDVQIACDVMAQAERELLAVNADARLAKIKRGWQEDILDDDEYREQRAEVEQELAAAQAAVEQAQRRAEAVEAAGAATDAEEAMLRHLADLKAAVAGKIEQAPDLAAVRATIGQLIESVTLASRTRPFPVWPEGDGVLDVKHPDELDPTADGDFWLWVTVKRDAYDFAARHPRRATLDVPGDKPIRPQCR
ncbi:MAG TPA: recombinase family protein [Solirubrobacteraceae bacterium]|nr:recombinase family protein [Solirubrobacteraceae bacterium]